MEDAAKALLIAAGVFFAILILSALVMFYNQISAFHAADHEATMIEQTREFNARFENFNRKDIRGSDLISLMNRVIDYNNSQSYQVGTGYERIIVNIVIGQENLDKFRYERNDKYISKAYGSKNNKIQDVITNTTGEGTVWQNDKQLIAITETSSNLCEILNQELGVSNPTDTQLQQLSSKASTILVEEDKEYDKSNRIKRADIIKDVLGIQVNINPSTGGTENESKDTIDKIKYITSQYYQYTQFKRAVFDCTGIIYDSDTNRVRQMSFELQVDDEGNVVFD